MLSGLILTVIASKWVLSFTYHGCHKLFKIYFLYTFSGLNVKTEEMWCFAIYSLMFFPFKKVFTDNLKIHELIYLK